MWRNGAATGQFGRRIRFGAACLLGGLIAGCANPGPPRPPSLNLPAIVRDLRADRVGDWVETAWTTPHETTEKTAVLGPVTAVLCREDAPPSLSKNGRPAIAAAAGCTEVARRQVTPGPARVAINLPADLTAGSARLLAFRVELLNQHGRSAGRSPLAWTVAGAPPSAAAKVEALARPRGVRLTWKNAAATVENGRMEVERRTLAPPTQAADSNKAPKHAPGLPSGFSPGGKAAASAGQVRLSAHDAGAGAGEKDTGGLIDASVEPGATYRYVAQRVRQVTLAGHGLVIKGEPSAPVDLTYRDVFPPSAPQGLQAIPVGELDPGARLSVDLSWEPSPEPDVAGYFVQRRETGVNEAWAPLNPTALNVPAFHDATVLRGRQYLYQVIAVDGNGNSSVPSQPVSVDLNN